MLADGGGHTTLHIHLTSQTGGAEQNPLTAFQLTEPGKTWKVSVAFPKHINQIILKISGIHTVQPAGVILHQANQITLLNVRDLFVYSVTSGTEAGYCITFTAVMAVSLVLYVFANTNKIHIFILRSNLSRYAMDAVSNRAPG